MSTPIAYEVYNVVDRKDKDPYWNRVGGAFKFRAKDGRNGINFPNMNIVLMEPKPEENGEPQDLTEVNTGAEA